MIKKEFGFDSVRSTCPVTQRVFPTSVVFMTAACRQPAIEVVGRAVGDGVIEDVSVGVLLGATVGVVGTLVWVDVGVSSMSEESGVWEGRVMVDVWLGSAIVGV